MGPGRSLSLVESCPSGRETVLGPCARSRFESVYPWPERVGNAGGEVQASKSPFRLIPHPAPNAKATQGIPAKRVIPGPAASEA